MVTSRRLIARVLFVLCTIILLANNYTSFLHQLLGDHPKESTSSRNAPRAANPGYGDISTDIDLDADIEDDQIAKLSKSVDLIEKSNLFTLSTHF